VEKELFFALLRQLQVTTPCPCPHCCSCLRGGGGGGGGGGGDDDDKMFMMMRTYLTLPLPHLPLHTIIPTSRGPELVVSQRDFIATVLDAFVVRHL